MGPERPIEETENNVLVAAEKYYKYPWLKTLAKLEKEYETVPMECVLKRQRIFAKVEHLKRRNGMR